MMDFFVYFIVDTLFYIVARYPVVTLIWLRKNITGNRITYKQCLNDNPWFKKE